MKSFLFPTLLLLALLGAAPAARAEYTITSIADNSSFNLFDAPSINAARTVAFNANLNSGGSGIFTYAGRATNPLYLSNGSIFSSFANPIINAAGTVAFYASLDSGGYGIFTGAGGATNTIALTSGSFSAFDGTASINAAGTVAFWAGLDSGDYGIFTGAGGATTTIAVGPTLQSFDFTPSINAAGTVAFASDSRLSRLGGGNRDIYTSTDGVATVVANYNEAGADPDNKFRVFGPPVINAAGTVAFQATLLSGNNSGIFAVTPAITEIALSRQPIFRSFDTIVSINSAGMVAFRGFLDVGRYGLYVGDGGEATRVIGIGDAFNGSTVNYLQISASGLNDNGDIAFLYSLANGTEGVAVAYATPLPVPEPSSALLLALGAAAIIARRRSRKHRNA